MCRKLFVTGAHNQLGRVETEASGCAFWSGRRADRAPLWKFELVFICFCVQEAGHLDLELSPVRLLDVVETALMLCSDSASNKRLDLCYWCQPSACATFLLDATRVQQILLNYLSNAIKVQTHAEINGARVRAFRRCLSACCR